MAFSIAMTHPWAVSRDVCSAKGRRALPGRWDRKPLQSHEKKRVSERRNRSEESPGRSALKINTFQSYRQALIYTQAVFQGCISKSVIGSLR